MNEEQSLLPFLHQIDQPHPLLCRIYLWWRTWSERQCNWELWIITELKSISCRESLNWVLEVRNHQKPYNLFRKDTRILLFFFFFLFFTLSGRRCSPPCVYASTHAFLLLLSFGSSPPCCSVTESLGSCQLVSAVFFLPFQS